jgi:hypothetical protein
VRDEVNLHGAARTEKVRHAYLADLGRAMSFTREVADATWVNVRARCMANALFGALALVRLEVLDEMRTNGSATPDDGLAALSEALERIVYNHVQSSNPDDECARAVGYAITRAGRERPLDHARDIELAVTWAKRAIEDADARYARTLEGDPARVRPGKLDIGASRATKVIDARESLVWALLSRRDLEGAAAVVAETREIAKKLKLIGGEQPLGAQTELLEAQVLLARGETDRALEAERRAAASGDAWWVADKLENLGNRLGIAGYAEPAHQAQAIAAKLKKP